MNFNRLFFNSVTNTYNKRPIVNSELETTERVFKKVKEIEPLAFIAGGAPVDWLYNIPCNDVDLFIPFQAGDELSQNLLIQLVMTKVEATYEISKSNLKSYKNVKTMRYLSNVYNVSLDNVKFQFIFINKDDFLEKPKGHWSIIEDFSSSFPRVLCDLAPSGNLEITPHMDFIITKQTGCVFLIDGYHRDDYHPKKTMKKIKEGKYLSYPKWSSKEDAIESFVKKQLQKDTDMDYV